MLVCILLVGWSVYSGKLVCIFRLVHNDTILVHVFEASNWNFQMLVADPSQSFQCLACKSPQLLQNLPSLQLHFATEHGVVNLLSTPATQAVLPPASLSCHADSCKPGELFASCLFCGATGLEEEEMKEHLGSRHGVVFQQDWKRFCSQHCR